MVLGKPHEPQLLGMGIPSSSSTRLTSYPIYYRAPLAVWLALYISDIPAPAPDPDALFLLPLILILTG